MSLTFSLDNVDCSEDPLLEPAHQARLSVALANVDRAYKFAVDNFRVPDTKASGLTGWIAALLAVAVFQRVAPMTSPQSACVFASFVCLLIALRKAILVQHPREIVGAGIHDPMDLYRYQSADHWGEIETDICNTDQLAEAQTQLRLIQRTDEAIRALRTATDRKCEILQQSHNWYWWGLLFLSGSLLWPIVSYWLPALRWR